ncbi:MAG: histidine kinase [Candidatus Azobacteroides sp.]|nr:histidine kinase [Candidatus Azobacteroides sp.]
MIISHNKTAALFIDKNYRIYRHMILIFLLLCMTLSFVWYIPSTEVPVYYKMIGWGIYFVLFTGSSYHFIYRVVPALLKGKIATYVSMISMYTIFLIAGVISVQYLIMKMDTEYMNTVNILLIIVNIAAFIFIMCFLFLGITALLLVKERMHSDMKKAELESSILQSELKLLKNQVNPHFLFNMLNNANMLLKKDHRQASKVLFKLEDLLRYQINDNKKEKVNLGDEITFIGDYLNLEKIRRDNFDYSIQETGYCKYLELPPFLFIVFVENAVKHNADNENRSYVYLTFRYMDNKLEFTCKNSKPTCFQQKNNIGGLGLGNIRRRLQLLYPGKHQLTINDEELKYTVKLSIEL